MRGFRRTAPLRSKSLQWFRVLIDGDEKPLTDGHRERLEPEFARTPDGVVSAEGVGLQGLSVSSPEVRDEARGIQYFYNVANDSVRGFPQSRGTMKIPTLTVLLASAFISLAEETAVRPHIDSVGLFKNGLCVRA